MADPPPNPEPREHTRGDTGTPRWVKVLGVIALVLALLVVVLLLTDRGHGPGRHTPSGGDTVHPSVMESTGPAGGHAPAQGNH